MRVWSQTNVPFEKKKLNRKNWKFAMEDECQSQQWQELEVDDVLLSIIIRF